jgi:hypothetical protein
MLLDKFQYLPGDAGVAANITTINFPVAQLFHLSDGTMPTVTFVACSSSGRRTQSSQSANLAVPSGLSCAGA